MSNRNRNNNSNRKLYTNRTKLKFQQIVRLRNIDKYGEKFGDDRKNTVHEGSQCIRIRKANKQYHIDGGSTIYHILWILHNRLPRNGFVLSHICNSPTRSKTFKCVVPQHVIEAPQSQNSTRRECHDNIIKFYNY